MRLAEASEWGSRPAPQTRPAPSPALTSTFSTAVRLGSLQSQDGHFRATDPPWSSRALPLRPHPQDGMGSPGWIRRLYRSDASWQFWPAGLTASPAGGTCTAGRVLEGTGCRLPGGARPEWGHPSHQPGDGHTLTPGKGLRTAAASELPEDWPGSRLDTQSQRIWPFVPLQP